MEDYNLMFYLSAAESNYTVDQSLFPSRDVSPTEATSDLSKWTNEAMNHCLSKTDDGERAECILGVLLLLVQAAKVDGRQLDISTCRSIHPSLKTFLSVIGQTSLPGIKGITEDLSDKLAPRIAFAEIMKRHTDSRLSQLSKFWKPQNQHGICSGCRRTVMMWITWRCKICTNLLCYECYHAIMCGTVKHHCSGGEVNYNQINFEKEYQPYQKIDSSNSSTLSECHKDCDDYQDCQAEDDHQRGCKEKTRKDNVSPLKPDVKKPQLTRRGAVQLQSATGKKAAGRTVGGPCGCHKSKPCNSFKCRCRQANQPCTVDCKCYNHVCFFNKELQQKESSANSSNIHARLPGQDSTVKEVLMQGKWKDRHPKLYPRDVQQ